MNKSELEALKARIVEFLQTQGLKKHPYSNGGGHYKISQTINSRNIVTLAVVMDMKKEPVKDAWKSKRHLAVRLQEFVDPECNAVTTKSAEIILTCPNWFYDGDQPFKPNKVRFNATMNPHAAPSASQSQAATSDDKSTPRQLTEVRTAIKEVLKDMGYHALQPRNQLTSYDYKVFNIPISPGVGIRSLNSIMTEALSQIAKTVQEKVDPTCEVSFEYENSMFFYSPNWTWESPSLSSKKAIKQEEPNVVPPIENASSFSVDAKPHQTRPKNPVQTANLEASNPVKELQEIREKLTNIITGLESDKTVPEDFYSKIFDHLENQGLGVCFSKGKLKFDDNNQLIIPFIAKDEFIKIVSKIKAS